ncbi:serine/arginine repetitive matrix protein 2-like [Caloenas nicobarica]|uniref:serine/arginine repetitive matrix protein 2-like n=1 Tax=Caloenas nicobarica TaxID=187106 RepID=UPI0032B7A0F3
MKTRTRAVPTDRCTATGRRGTLGWVRGLQWGSHSGTWLTGLFLGGCGLSVAWRTARGANRRAGQVGSGLGPRWSALARRGGPGGRPAAPGKHEQALFGTGGVPEALTFRNGRGSHPVPRGRGTAARAPRPRRPPKRGEAAGRAARPPGALPAEPALQAAQPPSRRPLAGQEAAGTSGSPAVRGGPGPPLDMDNRKDEKSRTLCATSQEGLKVQGKEKRKRKRSRSRSSSISSTSSSSTTSTSSSSSHSSSRSSSSSSRDSPKSKSKKKKKEKHNKKKRIKENKMKKKKEKKKKRDKTGPVQLSKFFKNKKKNENYSMITGKKIKMKIKKTKKDKERDRNRAELLEFLNSAL